MSAAWAWLRAHLDAWMDGMLVDAIADIWEPDDDLEAE